MQRFNPLSTAVLLALLFPVLAYAQDLTPLQQKVAAVMQMDHRSDAESGRQCPEVGRRPTHRIAPLVYLWESLEPSQRDAAGPSTARDRRRCGSPGRHPAGGCDCFEDRRESAMSFLALGAVRSQHPGLLHISIDMADSREALAGRLGR